MDQPQRDRAVAEIKQKMESLSIDQAELGRRTGISKNTITSLMAGNNVREGTLRKVRKELALLPTEKTETVDADVETVSLAVKTWLNDLPHEERPTAVAHLIRCVVTWAQSRPNG